MSVLAIIPARSGSKSLPHKNIRSYGGVPLLGLAVLQACQAELVDRVIVSTDDEQYAKIAASFGAEVPFLRPADISGDLSTDLEVFDHALSWWSSVHETPPELVVHVRPTYPNRTSRDIDDCVRLIRSHPEWDSVRSVSPAAESPLKMWWKRPDGTIDPVTRVGSPESHSMPRQALPVAWIQNACVDVIRPGTIISKRSMAGTVVGAFPMSHHHDIDTAAQFESSLVAAGSLDPSKAQVICVDIDGVIATLTPRNDYRLAQPQVDVIEYVNALFRAGHRIILFTARGSATGLDWTELTREQMREWKVCFHELRFGKPAADVYVDDRAANVDRLRQWAMGCQSREGSAE
jgi:CMP-N,N'-diacetyllegionaminic acid synthase